MHHLVNVVHNSNADVCSSLQMLAFGEANFQKTSALLAGNQELALQVRLGPTQSCLQHFDLSLLCMPPFVTQTNTTFKLLLETWSWILQASKSICLSFTEITSVQMSSCSSCRCCTESLLGSSFSTSTWASTSSISISLDACGTFHPCLMFA